MRWYIYCGVYEGMSGRAGETRGLIYKGIYAQKMAYASFYAMFAIYKILT